MIAWHNSPEGIAEKKSINRVRISPAAPATIQPSTNKTIVKTASGMISFNPSRAIGVSSLDAIG